MIDSLHPAVEEVAAFYAANLRLPFFTAFLTVGGFLLSLKAFILINMKEKLYDSHQYRERHERNAALAAANKAEAESLYAPLQRLASLLFYAILVCLLASVSQITLGLVRHWAAALVCIALATLGVTLLLVSLFNVRSTLKYWFALLEHGTPADVAPPVAAKEGTGKPT